MKNIEKLVRPDTFFEKRSDRRCKPEIDAFVSFKNYGVPLMCKLFDICLGGLSFGCSAGGNLLSNLNKLSIVIPKPVFYLKNVSFQVVSDSEIDIGSANGFATRRCGVKFVDLKSKQIASLNCLIDTLLALPWGFSFTEQNVQFQEPTRGVYGAACFSGHGP